MMAELVYLNGEYLPLAEARVPVLDRGFIFGDGVYEVIPVYSRQAFRLDAHLARLQQSLDAISLANPHLRDEWAERIERIIAAAAWEDQGVYLQVTRGPAPRDHAFPENPQPTVFLMAMPLAPPAGELVAQGVTAITAADNRWLRCDIKSVSLLANVLLRQQSVDAGCAETILVRDGMLTEGSASSVFIVKAGKILAPPQSHLMLPGITYDVVLELAHLHNMPHAIRPIREEELRDADEIWLTSSTKEVLAVTWLDGRPVGEGRPGPVYARMHAAYQAFKHTVMRGGGGA
jgi:D-alanine transaminase